MNGKGFMKGIQFSHFLDTVAEWHALTQGFCEVMCPWPPRHKLPSPSMGEGQGEGDLLREIHDEHHYYMAGRALGVMAWLAIITIALANIIP